MIKRLFSILLLATATVIAAGAAEATDSTTIADRINAAGQSTIVQPARLNARLVATRAAAEVSADDAHQAAAPTGGYRIQVFSGNNARTSKGEAGARAAKISAQFPEHATYVTYDAPYWRLRVGDFRTYEDARGVLSMMKSAFPAYAREMRLVRDRIKL